MRGTNWTAEQRAEARKAYEEHGTREAARLTGIPFGTISAWAFKGQWHTECPEKTRASNEALSALCDERKKALAATMLVRAEEIVVELGEEHDHTTVTEAGKAVKWHGKHSPRGRFHLAQTAEKLVNLAQVLTGGATSRIVVSQGQVETEARQAADKLIDLAERRQRQAS